MNPLIKEAVATLYINLGDSRCGSCSRSANPGETHHYSRLGYRAGSGCGARYTSVSSDYAGMEGYLLGQEYGFNFESLRGLPVLNVMGELIGTYLQDNQQ